jgi:hypothetical protein
MSHPYVNIGSSLQPQAIPRACTSNSKIKPNCIIAMTTTLYHSHITHPFLSNVGLYSPWLPGNLQPLPPPPHRCRRRHDAHARRWSRWVLDGAINDADVADGASACGTRPSNPVSRQQRGSMLTPYAIAGRYKGRGRVGRYVVLLTVVRDLRSVLDEL